MTMKEHFRASGNLLIHASFGDVSVFSRTSRSLLKALKRQEREET
jgi:aspartate carbamoyltransferase catalytic subunit